MTRSVGIRSALIPTPCTRASPPPRPRRPGAAPDRGRRRARRDRPATSRACQRRRGRAAPAASSGRHAAPAALRFGGYLARLRLDAGLVGCRLHGGDRGGSSDEAARGPGAGSGTGAGAVAASASCRVSRPGFAPRSGPPGRLHRALRSAGAWCAAGFLSFLAATSKHGQVSFTLDAPDGRESAMKPARWT